MNFFCLPAVHFLIKSTVLITFARKLLKSNDLQSQKGAIFPFLHFILIDYIDVQAWSNCPRTLFLKKKNLEQDIIYGKRKPVTLILFTKMPEM